ncbi:MAG: NUDIX domain-containing protein [Chloroflexi bacterium]|nr:NUDIX domain-containing protein [Chloroflexota bacterium]OJV96831.1 MAG: hypothetical protein BGO39_09015 [Chloroflexi bacterium 54-19]
MTIIKEKMFAYITNGGRLLVFSHPLSPEAGIQVPAGSLKPGEDPAEGVMREAFEETGLSGLEMAGYLGEQNLDRTPYGARDEIHHRRFYHLVCPGNPPETWRHYETDPSDGSPGPIPFDFFWVKFPEEVPPLIAEHDFMLVKLKESMDS